MNFFSKILAAASIATIIYGISVDWFWSALLLVTVVDASWISWRLRIKRQTDEENYRKLKKNLRKMQNYSAARESMWWIR